MHNESKRTAIWFSVITVLVKQGWSDFSAAKNRLCQALFCYENLYCKGALTVLYCIVDRHTIVPDNCRQSNTVGSLNLQDYDMQ